MIDFNIGVNILIHSNSKVCRGSSCPGLLKLLKKSANIQSFFLLLLLALLARDDGRWKWDSLRFLRLVVLILYLAILLLMCFQGVDS